MTAVTRRLFLMLTAAAVPLRIVAAPQSKRRTKDELQQQLKSTIIDAARNSHVELADSGQTVVNNWTRKGADRLLDEQSDANVARATTNARLCGQMIGEAGAAAPDRKATGALILGVFQKICPLYPFC
jgi:hypothetical protein